jgi:hypothetical protein
MVKDTNIPKKTKLLIWLPDLKKLPFPKLFQMQIDNKIAISKRFTYKKDILFHPTHLLCFRFAISAVNSDTNQQQISTSHN